VAELVGASNLAGQAIWPLVGMTLVYGLFGVRMLLEIRSSRGATASLACAAAFYATAAAAALIWPDRTAESLAALAQSSAAMLGHVCAWYAVVVYARHVYLDAQGALPIARKERKKPRKAAEDASGDAIDKSASRSVQNSISSVSRSSLVTPTPAPREKVNTPQSDSGASDDERPAKRSWFARLLGRRDASDEAREKKPRKQRPTKAERLAARQAQREAKRQAKLAAKSKLKSDAKSPSSADTGRSKPGRTSASKPMVASIPVRPASKPQDAPDDAPRGGFARLWRKQDDADEAAAPRKSAVAKPAARETDDDDGDESAVGPDGRTLSKSERRRLRKLQRRAARRAA